MKPLEPLDLNDRWLAALRAAMVDRRRDRILDLAVVLPVSRPEVKESAAGISVG